jgi:hypothetical protein
MPAKFVFTRSKQSEIVHVTGARRLLRRELRAVESFEGVEEPEAFSEATEVCMGDDSHRGTTVVNPALHEVAVNG